MGEKSLEEILTECLREAERTGDTDALLRDHSRHAAHLRPLLELASALRQTYARVPHPPGALAWGKLRLISEARLARGAAAAQDGPAPRRDRPPATVPRVAASLIIAAVIAVVGMAGLAGVAHAAPIVGPGHPLYGLDRALERLEARLTRDPEAAAVLRFRLAWERLQELVRLVRMNDQEHLTEALDDYADSVTELLGVLGAHQGLSDAWLVSTMDRVLASQAEQLNATLQSTEEDGGDGTSEEAEGAADSSWCVSDGTHPVAQRLAVRYEVELDQVEDWFCKDGYGFGEVLHALEMSQGLVDVTADEVLELRAKFGWAQVWQLLGLVGERGGRAGRGNGTA
ncbi:MAG: DUF5667 domain-containing protein [Anaerolineae bacterium]